MIALMGKRISLKKSRIILLVAVVLIVLIILEVTKPSKVPIVAQLVNQNRPANKMPTLTSLPEFPDIPLYAEWLSREQKDELIQTLMNNKVSTWPVESSRSYRAGKFTSTRIFGADPPTEEQAARLAPNYDNILFGSNNSELIPLFKKYNPDLTFFIYVDSGLNPNFNQSDAGGVDEEDMEWIIKNHPDWILKDK